MKLRDFSLFFLIFTFLRFSHEKIKIERRK